MGVKKIGNTYHSLDNEYNTNQKINYLNIQNNFTNNQIKSNDPISFKRYSSEFPRPNHFSKDGSYPVSDDGIEYGMNVYRNGPDIQRNNNYFNNTYQQPNAINANVLTNYETNDSMSGQGNNSNGPQNFVSKPYQVEEIIEEEEEEIVVEEIVSDTDDI